MEGITVRLVQVTTLAARGILTTAFEAGQHGSAYWAHALKVQRKDNWIWRVEIEDLENKKNKHIITDAEIKIAVGRILSAPDECDYRNTAGLGRIIMGEFDGPLADVIVQVACFGKVIYG